MRVERGEPGKQARDGMAGGWRLLCGATWLSRGRVVSEQGGRRASGCTGAGRRANGGGDGRAKRGRAVGRGAAGERRPRAPLGDGCDFEQRVVRSGQEAARGGTPRLAVFAARVVLLGWRRGGSWKSQRGLKSRSSAAGRLPGRPSPPASRGFARRLARRQAVSLGGLPGRSPDCEREEVDGQRRQRRQQASWSAACRPAV